MAAVAARAVMGTKRVAPFPSEENLVDSPGKECPEQPSCWPSLLTTSPSQEDSEAENSDSASAREDGVVIRPHSEESVSSFVDDSNSSSEEIKHVARLSPRTLENTSCLEDAEDSLEPNSPSGDFPTPDFQHEAAEADKTSAVDDDEADASDAGAPEVYQLSAAALVDGGMQELEEDACSICLDNFTESEPATLTQCNHEYHFQCVLEWAQRKEECPMCWQPLRLSDPSSQELLEACARERKERAATSELLAQARMALPAGRMILIRPGAISRVNRTGASRNPSSASWRARSTPASQLTASPASLPTHGVERGSSSSTRSRWGMGQPNVNSATNISSSSSRSRGAGSASASPASASLSSSPSGGHHHFWFRRPAGSSSHSAAVTTSLFATESSPTGATSATATPSTSALTASLSTLSTADTCPLSSTTSAPVGTPLDQSAAAASATSVPAISADAAQGLLLPASVTSVSRTEETAAEVTCSLPNSPPTLGAAAALVSLSPAAPLVSATDVSVVAPVSTSTLLCQLGAGSSSYRLEGSGVPRVSTVDGGQCTTFLVEADVQSAEVVTGAPSEHTGSNAPLAESVSDAPNVSTDSRQRTRLRQRGGLSGPLRPRSAMSSAGVTLSPLGEVVGAQGEEQGVGTSQPSSGSRSLANGNSGGSSSSSWRSMFSFRSTK